VALAEQRLMAPVMDVNGTVISLNDSQIATEVEGKLTSIAQVGTRVEEGDVIATIDDRLLKIAHRRATATLKRLQADMTFREQDVARFQDLASRDNASKSRLEEVISQRDMVRQDVEDAKALVDRTKGDLERANIRAPFSGTVVARLVNKGEYLTIGAEVVRFVDTENVEIVLPAPLAITQYLVEGAEVPVQSAKGTHSLPIRTVVPVGDAISRMVEVRLKASGSEWAIGTPVKISLPKDVPVESVAVPRDAIVLKSGRSYFFKIDANNKAQQVNADIQSTVGLWVALRQGVEPGDRIVVRGAERLQPDQSVIIQE
jgi:RND family efflux transporter MFP subunit